LIGRKRFRAPGNKVWIRGVDIPRCAAIPRVALGAIMRPARMLRRGVEIDVSDLDSRSQRHAEKLDGAVQVHIKDRVFIVPHAATQVGGFVTHEKDTIVARIRSGLVHRGVRPSLDGRLHAHRGSRRRKGESARTAANRKRAIREIVEHVALVGMRLAPGEFMGGDVSSFAKVAHIRN
jgi:hypothetical protein